jgi:hypothetical protein
MNDTQLVILIVSLLTAICLIGIFWKMQPGFGPFNLRVVGIVLVASFSTLLGLLDSGKVTAAMGILGAIAGYLFGIKDKNQ